MQTNPSHFKGKDAVDHVIEAQAEGIFSATEIHGTETPGHISAAADAARETSVVLVLLAILIQPLSLTPHQAWLVLGIFAFGWFFWKVGRSAWLGWSRLERLHRIMAEEKWEIEHHRSQEREELSALYQAKGFEGKLLEDVLDVLMADGDRLLRVMLEEELGLSLESQEHPLKQGLGAGLGTFTAVALCALGYGFYGLYGMAICAVACVALSASVAAKFENNKVIPAAVWNVGIAILALGSAHFLLDFILQVVTRA
jgi:hypothetical protein